MVGVWILIGILIGLFILIFCIVLPVVAIKKRITNRHPVRRRHSYSSGNYGEQMVQDILDNDIPGEYYVKNNVCFKYKDKVVEIDHIVINKYGIFVIETKDWYGIVTVDNNSKKRILDNGKDVRSRQDPIQQNTVHIKRLKEILCVDSHYFHNIVVFTERADISNINSKFICYISELRERLILKQEQLTEKSVVEIKEKLDNYLNENVGTLQDLEKFLVEKQNRND